MYSFEIHCPNEGLGRVMQALKEEGITTDSRNGPVIRFPKPVCLEYPNPRRRVLDHPIRDANHFFHLAETIWMFAGMETVAELDLFNEQFKQYSDDGFKFAAPYGYRWRHHFGFDQITKVVEKLRENPEDRRIVLQMWDPKELIKKEGKDFACNQNIMFDTRPILSTGSDSPAKVAKSYVLDMTVTNRSNDLIYGAMGSNLFHMSMLHEYIAYHASLTLGTYYQISKNMHLYLENECSKRCWLGMNDFASYESPGIDRSLTELGLGLDYAFMKTYMQDHVLPKEYEGTYLGNVVAPIFTAYKIYKLKKLTGMAIELESRVEVAQEILDHCRSDALRTACVGWLRDKLQKIDRKKVA